MKLLIELDEEYVKAIDKIRFLVGGRTDRKLQLEIIKAIKNGKALEQEPKSEWEYDHAILKAYSDGANEALDRVRAEIEQGYCEVNNDYDHGRNYGLYMATQIIDKYKEGEE